MTDVNEEASLPESDSVADSSARLQALDISRSFCVQAPAGSGKTELLTQRILTLLAQAQRPEEILAFTFTRKAAAEMRNRLLESLESAHNRTELEISQLAPHAQLTHTLATAVLEHDKAMNWHLLANTQRLRITTIDAFNAYLTSQLPITSEFGAQPEISHDMDIIFQAAIQNMLAYLDDETAIAGHISTLLAHLDNNLATTQKLLCHLLRNREHWLGHIMDIHQDQQHAREVLTSNLHELIEHNMQQAREQLSRYSVELMQLLRFAADNLALNDNTTLLDCAFTDALPDSHINAGKQWLALSTFFLTTTGSLRKTVTVKNGFPAPSSSKNPIEKASFKEHKDLFAELYQRFLEQPEILETFTLLQHLPDSEYGEQQWQVISALTHILPFLVAHLEMELKAQAKVDYVKVSTAALHALGTEDQPTDLTLRLDYKFSHILVDEFQDTSAQQTKLLEKLTWGWQQGDGRSLFIVGDGMQSCYSFRNANVGLFLSARDNGIGNTQLDSLKLEVNFRSDAAVVAWVNSVFKRAFPAQDNISRGAVAYSPSQALGNASPACGVDTLLWLCPKELEIPKAQQHSIEADAIVACIENIQAKHPASTIAILVRTRSHLKTIVPALRAADIAWNASDIDALSSYPEIIDLLSMLKALLNLSDKTAWLALLRSPCIGLGLADIHQLVHTANTSTNSLWQNLLLFESHPALSADAHQRLSRCVPILQTTRDERQHHSLRQWLEGCWLLLGGPATLDNPNELTHIVTFFEMLDEASSHGDIHDIHRFESSLEQVYVSGTQSADINLNIMTIHNAKGLEFDFVIIPGLDRVTRSSDNPLLLWKDHLNAQGEERLLMSVLNQKGQPTDSSYQYLKYEAGLRDRMENTRLLYIAITRAAKQTILLAQLNTAKGEMVAPSKSSLLATIWPQLENPGANTAITYTNIEDELGLSVDAPQKAITSTFSKQFEVRRLKASWKNPVQSKPAQDDDILDNSLLSLNKIKTKQTPHNLVEKRIGEIIHDALRSMVENNVDLAALTVIESMTNKWRVLLKPVCYEPDAVDRAIATIKDNLQKCINHPKAAWLFSSKHLEDACELSLSDYRLGYRKEFIIDRTFVDEDGIRWIIDYKSSRKGSDQPLQEFLEQQALIYRDQLQNYAALFNEMEQRPVQIGLFFTSVPYWLALV